MISIEGHIPTLSDELFPRFLTVGPMARRAEDLPLLMSIMAGRNKQKLRLDEPVDMSKLKVRYLYKSLIFQQLFRFCKNRGLEK